MLFELENLVYLCDSKFKFIKNTMKKVLSLLAVAGLFTFSSCESKKTEETTTTTEETTVESTDVTADTAAVTVDTAATTTTTDTTVTATPAQ